MPPGLTNLYIAILIAETVCVFCDIGTFCNFVHQATNSIIKINRPFSKVVWTNDLVHKTVENVFDKVCVNITSSLLHAGYDRVRCQLAKCVETIQVRKDAQEALTTQYIQAGWLGLTAKPSVNELLNQALVRMKGNPDQYDKFLSMLCAIEGLDQIVKAIEGGQGRWLHV